MITGKEFIQKLYSENNEEERLYSTGDSELDELLEKAFCEGYEYAQREFAEHKVDIKDVRSHRGLGRSFLLGGSAGAIGGYAGKKHAEKLDKEGASMEEIEKKSSKRAALVGGGTAAALGATGTALLGVAANKKIDAYNRGIVINNALNPNSKQAAALRSKKIPSAKVAGIALGTGAALGVGSAVASYLGAKKNAKERLYKRAKLEEKAERSGEKKED